MKPIEEQRRIDSWWLRWQRPLLTVAVPVMAMLAVLWLGYQFWRLLWQPAALAGRPVHPGAFDLLERYVETRQWFAGVPVYNNVYPPASYLLLWPFLGWLPVQPAITLWAATSLVAVSGLVAVAVRESGVKDRLGRLFMALLPLSMYATGATIGNGQINVHVLLALVAGILLLRRGPPSWPRDLAGASLVLAGLVKPNLSAPFFWIVTFALGRLRPAILVVLGYILLTLAASAFHPGGPVRQLHEWLTIGSASAFYSSASPTDPQWPNQVSRNCLQYILMLLGLQGWTHVLSVMLLAALGLWIYRHRRADLWVLLGVSAIAARFWTYHRWYDDLLLLLPVITLVRIVRTDLGRNAPAFWLLTCAILSSLAPGGLFLLPTPWDGVYVIVQIVVWVAMLVYLIRWRPEATVGRLPR